jgi:hypothetical protein
MKLCRSGLIAHVGREWIERRPIANCKIRRWDPRGPLDVDPSCAKLQPLFHCSGADGGGRTRTALRPRDFKSLPDVSGKPLITDENAKSIEKHLGKTTAIYCGRRILEAYCGGSRQKMTLTNC